MSPKEFSVSQKEYIKEKLIEKAVEYAKTIGIRKTSVEDLTKAVGISKGAFYKFYNSKEELFFNAFELMENKIKQIYIEKLSALDNFSKQNLKEVFKEIVFSEVTAEVIELVEKVELDNMFLMLGENTISKHLIQDTASVEEFFNILKAKNIRTVKTAEEFSAYLRAVFCLFTQRYIIGDIHFKKIVSSFIDVMIDESLQE